MPGRRIRVAVVFGGRSSEHAISCVSAGSVLRALDRRRYDVVPVGISRDGRWVLEPDDPDRLTITAGQLPEVDGSGTAVLLAADPTRRGLQVHASGDVPEVLAAVDVVFPVLHGPWGEDGTVQGLLEMAGVPYVGSGVFASAAAMDKGHMKSLFRSARPARRAGRGDHAPAVGGGPGRGAAAGGGAGPPGLRQAGPAGSSLGITKVHHPAGLVPAIEEARSHDPRVVVERSVEGAREIECGVLEDPDGRPRASVCAEIRVRGGHEFYDFAAKYLEDAADLVVPADLAPAVAERVRALAVAAFESLGCEGLARVDFFVTGDGGVVLNEVNTMPGFTAISMFPRMWAASGLSYPELVDRLVADALRRGTGLR